ncbi:MAG TPA: DUF5671 domain-containing protein [Chloroflexota bacterium]|nr:DUF5671 domain-containing protein [Chloroflexota bacterium]
MANIRRVYMFVVTAVSLNAVAWALIALLRNLLTPALNPLRNNISYQTEIIAMQLAVIIIGLPIYLAHWLWAERLAHRDEEEHAALLRRLYLYVMMTAFAIPIFTNAFGFVASALRLIMGVELRIPSWSTQLPDGANLVYTAVALVILALLWAYHHWLTVVDRSQVAETNDLAVIHRLYVYLFTFGSLVLLSVGSGSVLRWLLFQISRNRIIAGEQTLITAVTGLLVGAVAWFYFWRKAEGMFTFGGAREQASALRKFYLYLVIFLAALGTVSALTILLSGLFRQLLNVATPGSIFNVLSVLVVTAVLWAYHFFVLRQDMGVMPEVDEQAGVRRLYWYLIAGIGLLALLIGVGGDISVLIRSSGSFISHNLREQTAWFTAVLIAGLVVWIVPWRKIQMEVAVAGEVGESARRSLVRRLYLTFYLLLATLTFLGTSVYAVSQLIYLLLGGRTAVNLAADMAQAVAYALLAVVVWLYHGRLLRLDNAAFKQTEARRAQTVHVAVVDDADGRFAERLIHDLHEALPTVILHPIGLTPQANETLHTADEAMPAPEALAAAQIIVGPWTMTTPYVVHGETDMEMLAAVSASPGHKLLVPTPEPGWDWAGVGRWEMDTAVRQTIRAVKQLIAGQVVKSKSGLNLGTVIAVVLFLFLLVNLLPMLFMLPQLLF